MSLPPWKVRLTGSSAGTLDQVIVQIELVDRAIPPDGFITFNGWDRDADVILVDYNNQALIRLNELYDGQYINHQGKGACERLDNAWLGGMVSEQDFGDNNWVFHLWAVDDAGILLDTWISDGIAFFSPGRAQHLKLFRWGDGAVVIYSSLQEDVWPRPYRICARYVTFDGTNLSVSGELVIHSDAEGGAFEFAAESDTVAYVSSMDIATQQTTRIVEINRAGSTLSVGSGSVSKNLGTSEIKWVGGLLSVGAGLVAFIYENDNGFGRVEATVVNVSAGTEVDSLEIGTLGRDSSVWLGGSQFQVLTGDSLVDLGDGKFGAAINTWFSSPFFEERPTFAVVAFSGSTLTLESIVHTAAVPQTSDRTGGRLIKVGSGWLHLVTPWVTAHKTDISTVFLNGEFAPVSENSGYLTYAGGDSGNTVGLATQIPSSD